MHRKHAPETRSVLGGEILPSAIEESAQTDSDVPEPATYLSTLPSSSHTIQTSPRQKQIRDYNFNAQDIAADAK